MGVAAAAGGSRRSASTSSGRLTNLPSANTKSTGYAPANMLSAGLQQSRRRAGRDEGREPDGTDLVLRLRQTTSLNAQGEPRDDADAVPTARTRHTRPSRTRTPTSSSRTGSPARTRTTTTARTSCSRATRPAARPATITRINLDADAAHRVHACSRRRTTTGAPIRDDRRLDLGPVGAGGCCSRPRTQHAPTYSATPSYPSVVSRRLRRARPRRLRGHPERLRRQHLDRRGHRRREQGRRHRGDASRTASSTATSPSVPVTCRTGSSQVLQVLNAAGHADHGRVADATQRARPGRAPHLRQTSSRRSGSIVHDTAVDGTAPFNANTAAKAAHAHAVQAAGERRFRPGSHFTRVPLRRDRRHERRRAVENATAGRLGLGLEAHPARPVE